MQRGRNGWKEDIKAAVDERKGNMEKSVFNNREDI